MLVENGDCVLFAIQQKCQLRQTHPKTLWLTSGGSHGFPLINQELVIYMKYDVGLTIQQSTEGIMDHMKASININIFFPLLMI